MQRTQIVRKFIFQTGTLSLLATRRQLIPARVNPCISGISYSLVEPIRFHSEGKTEGEESTRTGQYLLNKDDVQTRVIEVIKNFEKVDASKVTPESHFINDLGLNSLDVVEVVFAIEQEFILDIPDHDAEKIQSIPDAVEYISQNPMAK